ncbi:DUF6708 domain-containing protein [Paraburkholderia dinghuensis]|uniref:DUF6708 domain-containing protein n=1 Tax=Paraburkholderia dinghuensis TaxID=2305225 RepID=A0A3N6MPF0_9BURK|nr:DUF6708 domain-containing protein [Paraburkholderia dinghuensis]RQH05804.1 hypothetical protein D1Y85_14435 [Paraburkholderia dinghuensis]
MAFDGLSWYRLNRPVSDDERASRLAIARSWSDTPKDYRTVFSKSENYLEICDANHLQKGWGVIAFLLPGLGSLVTAAIILWMMTHMPPIYGQRGELGMAYSVLGFFLFVMLCLASAGIWGLTRDCFNYTRKPIRLNRIDKMIYAFRHNGPGGVISIPWSQAFFYIERKPRAGLARTAPRVVRCLVLDDKKRVVGTFSIGTRVELAFDEDSPAGQKVMEELYQNFEYFRRFMEEGPSSIPTVSEFLSAEVSFRNSLKLQFDGASSLLNSGNPLMWLVMIVAAIPTFILALANYLAQLTCRAPVWPPEIEQACSAATPTEGLTI